MKPINGLTQGTLRRLKADSTDSIDPQYISNSIDAFTQRLKKSFEYLCGGGHVPREIDYEEFDMMLDEMSEMLTEWENG